MADDKIRGLFYNIQTKKLYYWNGGEYEEIGNVVPAPPDVGTYILKSTDGVLEWLQEQ